MLQTRVIFTQFKGRTAVSQWDHSGGFSYIREYKMGFAELPGFCLCLLTPNSTSSFVLTSAQLTSSSDCSQRHTERLLVTYLLLQRFFLFFSQPEFTTEFPGCNVCIPPVFCTWDAPPLLWCTTPGQDDICQCQKEE